MDSRIHRIIGILIAIVVLGSAIAVPLSAKSTDRVFAGNAATETIVRCFAEKGARVSFDAVEQWVNEFKDRYGESDASSWVIAERVACRHRYGNTA